MSNLSDDLKNALNSVISGAGDVVATTRDVTKDNVVKTLQASGEVANTTVDTVGKVTSEGVSIASQTGVSITQAITGLIAGIIEGVKEVGGDVGVTATEAAHVAVKSVREVGGDVGEAAVSSVEGVLMAADEIGSDSGELAKHAVIGTLKAADEIGSEAGALVRKALLNAAALPHDIIDALLTGKTE